MVRANVFVQELKRAGFELFTGVPCSYLTPLINSVIDSRELQYVAAANEGDAVAIACGAELGGMHGVVMCQNSGLGNAVSPFTSLTAVFRIPVLVITTWRGQPNGSADEPQHQVMGHITQKLLDLIEIPWEEIPENEEELAAVLARAVAHMRSDGTPYALILTNGKIGPRDLQTKPDLQREFQVDCTPACRSIVQRHEADDVLRTIQASVRETDVVLATTGYTGRALYALADGPNQLYMVGSMGCVSSLGLGLALAQPRRRVVALDGDGALLMRMGAMATIGHQRPSNFVHVLLDNGVHDSTGGQATASPSVDFASVARACGYTTVIRAGCLSELHDALADAEDRLKFIHVKTTPRTNRKLPRPHVAPREVAERLQRWLEVSG